jgi:methionyl-tRNA formyltransferase
MVTITTRGWPPPTLVLLGTDWAKDAIRRQMAIPCDYVMCGCTDTEQCPGTRPIRRDHYDLIITVGWRHLVPKALIDSARLGVIGFHSARLPEYPGRAPVPWAILRGDTVTHNTMLYLTDEPDAGDIIDHREVPVTTASEMNRRMGETAAEMLRQHLPALLAGTAPRTPQDRSRRGPLTKANGWQLLPEDRR